MSTMLSMNVNMCLEWEKKSSQMIEDSEIQISFFWDLEAVIQKCLHRNASWLKTASSPQLPDYNSQQVPPLTGAPVRGPET